MNQGSDSDEGVVHAPSNRRDWNPTHGHSSPISRSPYSEHSSLPSTSYTPRNNMPHHYQTPSVEDAPYIPGVTPSLSSPSSSSSPAVETTPPPSTPGQSAAPGTSLNGSLGFEENVHVMDDGSDPRQPAAGRPTYVQERGKQNIPPCLQPAKSAASRPATVCITFH